MNRPLRIAFMGYNAEQTDRAFRQFAKDNMDQVEYFKANRIALKNGTVLLAFPPSTVCARPDGWRFDQLILADDARKMIYLSAGHAIDIVLHCWLSYSCVPDEYKVQFYDLDAPEPMTEETRDICDAFLSGAKAVAAIGVSATELADAFKKLSQVTAQAFPMIKEINLIQRNSSLSRFQKWRLIRRIRRTGKFNIKRRTPRGLRSVSTKEADHGKSDQTYHGGTSSH